MAFRQGRLPDIAAMEPVNAFRSDQCGERAARIHLAGGRRNDLRRRGHVNRRGVGFGLRLRQACDTGTILPQGR